MYVYVCVCVCVRVRACVCQLESHKEYGQCILAKHVNQPFYDISYDFFVLLYIHKQIINLLIRDIVVSSVDFVDYTEILNDSII